MTEPEHIVPLAPVQPKTPPGPRRPSALVRVGIVTGTAALVLVGAVAAMGASPAPSGSTTTPSTPSASGDPNAVGVPGPWRGDFGGIGRGFEAITITGISGSNLSLETDDAWTRTITPTSTTVITKAGATITVSDLAVGDEIRFGQTKATDGTYSITKIVVVLPSLGGEVTAKTADTITVTQRDGTSATIHVDSATTYTVRGVETATLADITVGMHVRAEGTENSDGSLDASRVISGFGGRGGHGPGDHDGPKDVSPDASPSPSATP
jgi:hypothetical protein